jgi:UDP-N-acetyl-D-glucosamine dehydrogenase
VQYHEPHVPAFKADGLVMQSVKDLDAALADADCVLMVTDHAWYNWQNIQEQARVLVDTRAALPCAFCA